MTPPARAVYTALMGGYERLLEQPVARDSAIPFICLTDDPTLSSETWQIRIVTPAFPQDSVRSARALKIRGHDALAEFDETLWIDNSVLLTRDPGELLDGWLTAADFAVPIHSYRESVAAEFEAVGSMKVDDPVRVYEQLMHYAAFAPEVLSGRAHWTGVLARKNTPAVHRTMQHWLDNVLRYSRRDQLSIGLAIHLAEHPVLELEVDNFGSDWHEWPKSVDRRQKLRPAPDAEGGESPAHAIARMTQEIDELTLQSVHSVVSRDGIIADLRRQIAAISASRSAIFASRTWKIGSRINRALSPLRKLRRVIPGRSD